MSRFAALRGFKGEETALRSPLPTSWGEPVVPPNLSADNLELITIQTTTPIHIYQFVLSENYISYVNDVSKEITYLTQPIPSANDFMNSFRTYFKNYEDEITITPCCLENDTGNYRFDISVRCSPGDKLDDLSEDLQKQLVELKTERDDLLVRSFRTRSLSNKIIELYSERCETLGKYEKCPICYENIVTTNMYVPLCSHFICSDCLIECLICPVCRCEY